MRAEPAILQRGREPLRRRPWIRKRLLSRIYANNLVPSGYHPPSQEFRGPCRDSFQYNNALWIAFRSAATVSLQLSPSVSKHPHCEPKRHHHHRRVATPVEGG